MGNGHMKRVASFTSGDPRFIYAARRDGSGVMLLPDGEALQRREIARTQLMCPVPGCPAPEITTVGGERRHHYRHLVKDVATDHGAETWYHLEAKQVLAAWAAEHCPNAVVEIEKVLGSRDRIADVFATLPDGTQYAIEVQFSSLTPDLFAERHRWFRGAGIVDIWLFIHAGVHFRTGWNDTRNVTYSPTHRAVRDSDVRVLWVNPQQQRIGYATRTLSIGNRTYRTHAQDEGEFAVEPLEQFRLDARGMATVALAKIDQDTAAANDAVDSAERARVAAEQRWQDEFARRTRAAQSASATAKVEAGTRDKLHAAIIARWESSPEGRAAFAQFGGLFLPPWLLDNGELDIAIPARVWKWRLIREIVLPLRNGQRLTSSMLLYALGRTYPKVFPARETEREIRNMLRELEAEGLLGRVLGQPGYYTTVTAVDAVAPLKHDVAEGICPICEWPLSKEIPGMKVHFGDCERRAARLARG